MTELRYMLSVRPTRAMVRWAMQEPMPRILLTVEEGWEPRDGHPSGKMMMAKRIAQRRKERQKEVMVEDWKACLAALEAVSPQTPATRDAVLLAGRFMSYAAPPSSVVHGADGEVIFCWVSNAPLAGGDD